MYLLTVNNPKIAKGRNVGWLTGVLHLAPFKLSGVNVCPMAELAGCVNACLNTAGRGGIAKGGMVTHESVATGTRSNVIQAARIRRTQLFLTDRREFMAQLFCDILTLSKRAEREGYKLAIRLNGTSDIRWEDIPADHDFGQPRHVRLNIFEMFHNVQFYDYTKIPNRRRAIGIPNYSLTFSYSDRPEFQSVVRRAVEVYGDHVNYAAVFAGKLPETFLDRPVVNGDETDLRFLDAVGVVVGLTAKGHAKRDASGFVVR